MEDADTRALRIHRDAIVLDTHADTTPRFQDPSFDFAARHDKSDVRIDLPRAREGGLDVQFWSIWVGNVQGDGRAIREAMERIDAVWELARRYPNDVVVATDVAGIRRGVAEGKLVSLMGVEGGHMIENKLPVLRDFYRLGVRYMTLTHAFHTDWADSAGTGQPLPPGHGGLTPFGVEVVREMNRLGMMVDVSHVSDQTFWDALKASEAPVIASHSSCRAIYDHPRNLSDDMLRALAQKGGVVMINYYPGYTDPVAAPKIAEWYGRHAPELQKLRDQYGSDVQKFGAAIKAITAQDPVPQGSLETLLDHFDHALRVAGEDHVGLGSDFDGVGSFPVGLDEVSLLPNLTRGLLARGWSEAVVRKVLGENLLRTMSEVEAVAARLRSEPAAPPSRQ
ncbi:MAG TPA: dipeptidase [Myxococcota bacterium]|nr:dipeptidase [Myxococcota bacterium]